MFKIHSLFISGYDMDENSILAEVTFNPLSANPTKWPNTLKFECLCVCVCVCVCVCDYFVGFALKGLNIENSKKALSK